MKKTNLFLIAAALAFSGTVGQAAITGVSAYGSGEISCPVYTFNPNQNLLALPFHQYGSGNIAAGISTDTIADPTLSILNTINNDTGFPWTGYMVDVSMSDAFSISNPKVINSGWTASITQPVWNGSEYMGQVAYTGGIAVPDGQLLVFGYDITFAGGTQFDFGQKLTPVPEPGTVGFLALGALAFAGFGLIRKQRNLA